MNQFEFLVTRERRRRERELEAEILRKVASSVRKETISLTAVLLHRIRDAVPRSGDARPRLPLLSGGLLRLAERRLPEALSAAEKERWIQEMRADVASLPRRKRLRVAFNAWRKGAHNIPTGSESAPRSLCD